MTYSGERNPAAKLTAEKVKRIKALLHAKKPLGIWVLGKAFGVSHTAIWMIRKGRTWRNV